MGQAMNPDRDDRSSRFAQTADGTSLTLSTTSPVLPQHCVVCDSEQVQLIREKQERFPVILPGFYVLRSTDVQLPYCANCAAQRQRRLRRFGLIQLGLFLLMLFGGMGGQLGLMNMVAAAAIMLGGLLLFVCTWIVKPIYLYDVRVRQVRGGLCYKSAHTTFLRRLRESNGPDAARSGEAE